MVHERLMAALLPLVLGTAAHAQQAAVAAGGDAAGSGGSVAWSVGQVGHVTHTGTDGSVAEGVQQPYETSIITGQDEEGTDAILLFPNPATDLLVLQTGGHGPDGTLAYRLFGMDGKLLRSGNTTGTRTLLEVGALAPAAYFLSVVRGDSVVRSFKVIKH